MSIQTSDSEGRAAADLGPMPPTHGRRASRLSVTLSAVLVVSAVAASVAAGSVDVLGEGLRDTRTQTAVVAAARALSILGACGTVGALVVALLVSGSRSTNGLPAGTARLTSAASRWALVWAVSSLCSAGVLMAQAEGGRVDAFAWSVRSLVTTAWAAGVVAVLARGVRTRASALFVLGVACVALVPAVTGGHSWHAEARVLAVGSMVVHIVAITAWVGGLLALTMHAPRAVRSDAAVLRRFSLLALVCFVAVAGSGVVNVLSRLSWSELSGSGSYGFLLATKVLLFGVLGVLGLRHRRRTLPRLAAGDPGPFWTLVAGELVVMAMVLGLGAALAGAAPWQDATAEDVHALAGQNR